MIHRVRSGALASGLLTCLFAAGPARAGDAAPAAAHSPPFQQSLRELTIGAGIVNEEVILFPLYAPSEPAAAEETVGGKGSDLVFSEPDPKAGKPTIVATNGGATPALALAGTVVEGGRRDRMVRFDRLVPAKSAADVEVLPASTSHDARTKGSEFQFADFLAPSYLREGAQFSADPSLVPRFVSHFLEFRNANDKRESLLAVAGSDALAAFCLTCERSFSDWPGKKGAGTAVGAILVVRGRVQSMEVFATNAHLRAFLPPLLKGLAFPAAAIALRAKRLNVPLPWSEDPVGTLVAATKASEELLGTGAAVYGRLLAQTAVNLDQNTVTEPAP